MVGRVVVAILLGLASAMPVLPASAQTPLRSKVRAPDLDSGTWLNTRGPLTLADLRGKFVVLDFWTYCCINCKHVLPELKQLEREFPENVVVIGVHSPKFATERDEQNVREAIVRYDIEHPVLSDPQMNLWRKYEVDVWPSLRIIDPEGYVIAVQEGEFKFEQLQTYFTRQIAAYRRRGRLDETPLQFDLERSRVEPTPLRFPGKVLADEAGGRLFVADSSHHRIVVASLQGELLEVIGDGQGGDRDGDYAQARFRDPQGMALVGDKLYVADTENHKIRVIDLGARRVETAAGSGEKRDQAAGRRAMSRSSDLSSPWDVLAHNDHLLIAMAGTHQLWKMHLNSGALTVLAGNGVEDIIDGQAPPRGAYVKGTSSFAQPSGLASDGARLLVADSEGSSIRFLPLDGDGPVGTLVGTSRLPSKRLFTFGDRDGPAPRALLQHPIGVAYHEGVALVADTYNNKIRTIDVRTGAVGTLVGDGQAGTTDNPPRLDEPSGVSVAADKLYIADTSNHAIRVFDLANGGLTTLEIRGLTPPAEPSPQSPAGPLVGPLDQGELPETVVQRVRGNLQVELAVEPPAGCKLDGESPARLRIEWPEGSQLPAAASLDALPAVFYEGRFYVKAPLAAAQGEAPVTMTLSYFYCREGDNGFCRPAAARWSGRLQVAPNGASRLRLE